MRLATRLPAEHRSLVQPILGHGELLVGGVPPARGLLLRDLRVDHVQAWGLVRGLVEPSVQEAFRRHVGEGRIVWDVGANIGFFSLLAARLGAQVHAFEPVAATAAALDVNVRANGYADAIELHQVAVGATRGRAGFLLVDDPSWSHLADRGLHPRAHETVDVDVVALDELRLPPPHVIKIDVEGSEVAVLEGARRLLRDHRPVVIVELHGTGRNVCDLLRGHGYGVENLDGVAAPCEADAVRLIARSRLASEE